MTRNQYSSSIQLQDIDLDFDGVAFTSKAHDDIYFSRDGGLDEVRHVFCGGTDLAHLMTERNALTIAETGFGTGLNLMDVLRLRDEVQAECRIEFISFELCPLTADIIKSAHAPFPQIKSYSDKLCQKLPPRWPGFHRVILDKNTHLYLYYGDAYSQIQKLDFKADVWFLDGFNPRKNEDLWHEDLLAEVGRCAKDGAHLATFTVAASVRGGLEKAGFTLAKRPGFGRKRDMLTARKQGVLPPRLHEQKHVIIGGGIGGASLAYALSSFGEDALILDKEEGLAAGASGNPVGMQSARIRVHHDEPSRLSIACLSYANRLAEQAGVVLDKGAVLVNVPEREVERHKKLSEMGWPEALYTPLDEAEVAEFTSFPPAFTASHQPAACVIDPAAFTRFLARDAALMMKAYPVAIESSETGYIITTNTGEKIEAEHLYLAGGADTPQLLSFLELPSLDAAISAGQISIYETENLLRGVKIGIHYGGYMTPVIHGKQYWGASFNRTGQSEVTEEGHLHNQSLLPEVWRTGALPDVTGATGRLSYRYSSRDRMPYVGTVGRNIHVMTALGARGLTHAPLLADMLIGGIVGAPSGLDTEIIKAVSPHRYS